MIAELDRLAAAHAAGGRDHYLCVRDTRFNPLRAAWRASGADVARYPSELAAMLIYLNRTGYNGLFRVNASGEYNVPPGRYDNPKIVDRALLDGGVARRCRHSRSTCEQAPFDRAAGRGARRRLRLLRSTVRAAQQDGQFSRLYGTRLFG